MALSHRGDTFRPDPSSALSGPPKSGLRTSRRPWRAALGRCVGGEWSPEPRLAERRDQSMRPAGTMKDARASASDNERCSRVGREIGELQGDGFLVDAPKRSSRKKMDMQGGLRSRQCGKLTRNHYCPTGRSVLSSPGPNVKCFEPRHPVQGLECPRALARTLGLKFSDVGRRCGGPLREPSDHGSRCKITDVPRGCGGPLREGW